MYNNCIVYSTVAVVIGLFLTNLLHPGEGLSDEARARLTEGAAERAAGFTESAPPRSGIDLLVQIVPHNPLPPAANGDMLAVMFFALFLGVGLALTPTDPARRLLDILEGLYDVTMRLIGLVIAIAPIGVAALLFTLTAELGYEILGRLASYVGVVVLALAVHQFGVYSFTVWSLGGMKPWRFFRGVESDSARKPTVAMGVYSCHHGSAACGAAGGPGRRTLRRS